MPSETYFHHLNMEKVVLNLEGPTRSKGQPPSPNDKINCWSVMSHIAMLTDTAVTPSE